jgi:hypothetical protein
MTDKELIDALVARFDREKARPGWDGLKALYLHQSEEPGARVMVLCEAPWFNAATASSCDPANGASPNLAHSHVVPDP